MRPRSIGLLGASLLISACARGQAFDGAPDAAAGGPDAPRGADARATADAPNVKHPDAPDPQPGAPVLLLTEVALAPAGGEYIELANIGASPIDLSHYYLADHGNYFRVPGGTTVDSTDFIVKFPTGASIPAQSVVTVSIDTASSFALAYGAPPTYAITAGTMVPIATSGTASLTNAGELVVLFRWDGTSDLVRDVDMILVGIPSAANGLVDKSGLGVDGPDANTTPTMYATDSRTLGPQAAAPGSSVSTKRIGVEAGNELQTGSGNGLTGDDETSENIASTWDSTYTAPTPGVVPAQLLP